MVEGSYKLKGKAAFSSIIKWDSEWLCEKRDRRDGVTRNGEKMVEISIREMNILSCKYRVV